MLAGSEGHRSGNDERAYFVDSSRSVRFPQLIRSVAATCISRTPASTIDPLLVHGIHHDQALSNFDWLRFVSASKSLEPIAGQFLDTPAKLFEQRSRTGSCDVRNFKLEAFVSRPLYDHQCRLCSRLKNFSMRFNPSGFSRFLPKKHNLNNA
jgi:hypothetical protein